MNEATLTKMTLMKFYGMHRAFRTALETGSTNDYTQDEFIGYLTEAEWDDRQNRKIERTIKNARFRYKAAVEEIIYEPSRNIDKNSMMRLFECEYIQEAKNLLITGSTGVGKSYLATALGYQACIQGFRVLYFNSTRLFTKLKMAKADGSYLKELAKIQRNQLFILDDFGMQPLDNQSSMMLLEIIEDRQGKNAAIITSQIPVNSWYDIISEKTIADAILDRLVHDGQRIELKGESMRRSRLNKKT